LNKLSVLLVIAILLANSCQTTKIASHEPPAHVKRFFSTCAQSSDGGLVVNFHDENMSLATVDMDWVSTSLGDWIAELSGYLGQPLIRAQYRSQKNIVETSGSMVHQLPSLEVRSDGFLVADGHFVAVKADEVACLFRGVLPGVWLEDVVSVKQESQGVTYKIRQPKRRIEFRASRRQPSFCATIRWRSHFWLVGHKIDYCHNSRAEYTNQIKGFRDITMQWRENP